MSSPAEVADEDPIVADSDAVVDGYVPNISDADTEPAMLEEEEMPTYMSLSGSSVPNESAVDLGLQGRDRNVGERGEADANPVSSPYASDDQGGGSIYVVSSGEESNRPYDDEDYESDEMELDEEEEEEDDDDSRAGYNDDEEDSEGDIEPEQFERSSDDFVLRYDTNLEKHHKPRSRSLQDLTNSRGNLSRFVGKRRSVDIMGNYDPSLVTRDVDCPQDPLGDGKKSAKSRYADVPSKVKLYIQSIKEQTRRSNERRSVGNAVLRNFDITKVANAEVSCTRINSIVKNVKNHAENVGKTGTDEKPENIPDVTYGGRRLGENITEKEPLVVSESKRSNEKDGGRKIATIHENPPKKMANNVEKPAKPNGIIEIATENHNDNDVESMDISATNGQDQTTTIFDLRTLSYEEYANGDPPSSSKIEINAALRTIVDDKNGPTEFVEKREISGTTDVETIQRSASLKTDNAKFRPSAPVVGRASVETSELPKSTNMDATATTNHENSDVTMLWTMLDQKSAQFNEKKAQYDGIRDAFQKTLTENISLKRELEELKKTLAVCRAEHKPRETQVASSQTEPIPETEQTKMSIDETKMLIDESKPPIANVLSSSVDSALSSIVQWSDSNCSPAISINPPNMDHVLNSDDSIVAPERTPRREPRHMSPSFITSSRILQTLANITQGRTKTASPLARNVNARSNNDQGQSQRKSDDFRDSANETNDSRLRKRKASDVLDYSGISGVRFKKPHTSDVPRKKMNSDFDADGAFESPVERSTVGNPDEPIPGGSKDADGDNEQPDDFEDSEATEVPENVKCFVYREEADSKERSFLIQAKEPSKNNENGGIGKGTVRECGPYLLGNVEIRMSEANGTINIWGKELSQESDFVDVEAEDDESDPDEDPSSGREPSHDDQNTTAAKFVNGTGPFVCSTNKKSKPSPHLSRSNIGKYFRPAVLNSARVNALARDRETGRYAGSPIANDRTTGCEQCDNREKRRLHWPNCDLSTNNRRKRHSCCRRETETNDRDCDCDGDRDSGHLDEDVFLETVTNILSSRKNRATAAHGPATTDRCAIHGSKESYSEGTTRHRRPSETEGDCRHAKKRCSSCAVDLPSCSARLTPGNGSCCGNGSRSHSVACSCDDEDRPLLQNGHYETPETKRRRLSGRKVRGILTDLLRGCGGCRDRSTTSFATKESTSLPNFKPTVRVTPCTPPQPACARSSTNCASHSKQSGSRDFDNEKCCCSRRSEMAAKIESKLEFLTVEMERLRSRSDTFRGMLNLLNADAD